MIYNNETAGAVTWFILMYACKWFRNGINIIPVLWFSLRSWDDWFIYSLQCARSGSYAAAQMVTEGRPCAADQGVNVNVTVYGYSSSKGPEPRGESRWQQRLLSSSRVLNPSLWSLCSSLRGLWRGGGWGGTVRSQDPGCQSRTSVGSSKQEGTAASRLQGIGGKQGLWSSGELGSKMLEPTDRPEEVSIGMTDSESWHGSSEKAQGGTLLSEQKYGWGDRKFLCYWEEVLGHCRKNRIQSQHREACGWKGEAWPESRPGEAAIRKASVFSPLSLPLKLLFPSGVPGWRGQ